MNQSLSASSITLGGLTVIGRALSPDGCMILGGWLSLSLPQHPLFFFFFFIFYLSIQRERERERQREEQAPCRKPDVGLDPGSPGSHPGLKAC